jgi:hypothetical protein
MSIYTLRINREVKSLLLHTNKAAIHTQAPLVLAASASSPVASAAPGPTRAVADAAGAAVKLGESIGLVSCPRSSRSTYLPAARLSFLVGPPSPRIAVTGHSWAVIFQQAHLSA